jgi:tetratricopeptide (TPR) repeat protein
MKYPAFFFAFLFFFFGVHGISPAEAQNGSNAPLSESPAAGPSPGAEEAGPGDGGTVAIPEASAPVPSGAGEPATAGAEAPEKAPEEAEETTLAPSAAAPSPATETSGETPAGSAPGASGSAEVAPVPAAEGTAAAAETPTLAADATTGTQTTESAAAAGESDKLLGTEMEAYELFNKGLYPQAAAKYLELADATEKELGPDDPKTLRAKVHYSIAHRKAGYFTEAVAYIEKISPAVLNAFGEFSRENVDLENNDIISRLHGSILDKKLEESAGLLAETAVAAREGHFGPDHPETLTTKRIQLQIKHFARQLTVGDLSALKDIAEKQAVVLGANHPETLETRHELASATMDFYEKEEIPLTPEIEDDIRRLIMETLAEREAVFGQIHPDVSETMSLVTILDMQVGDYREAYDVMANVSDIEVRTLGPNHPWSVNSYVIMATLLRDLGHRDEMMAAFDKALASTLEFYKTENRRTNLMRRYLAVAYAFDLRDYKKAAELLRTVLNWQEKNIGENDEDTLLTMTLLARILDESGNVPAAKTLYEKILKQKTASLGETHEETVGVSNRLSYLDVPENDAKKAREIHERVYEKTKALLGPDHLETLRAQLPLALFYWSEGDDLKAGEHLESVVGRLTDIKGADDLETLNARSHLAHLYFDLGDFEKARDIATQILWTREQTQGERHEDTVYARHDLARIYLASRNFPKARPLFESVVDSQTELYGPEDERTLSSREQLGGLYAAMGERSLARQTFMSLLADVEKIRGQRDPVTTKIRNQLALVF